MRKTDRQMNIVRVKRDGKVEGISTEKAKQDRKNRRVKKRKEAEKLGDEEKER